jgi:hypothetical protein
MNSNSTVPLWQALVLALAAGLVGTFARIAYERTAELRTRMIQAADDFTIAVFRTITMLRDAEPKIRALDGEVVIDDAGDFVPDVQNAIDAARPQVDELYERVARVQLLFGASLESTTTRQAHLMLTAARNCQNAIRDRPHSITADPSGTQDRPSLLQFNRNSTVLMNGIDLFTEAARKEIRAWTILLWAKRQPRRARLIAQRIRKLFASLPRRRS